MYESTVESVLLGRATDTRADVVEPRTNGVRPQVGAPVNSERHKDYVHHSGIKRDGNRTIAASCLACHTRKTFTDDA